MAYPSAWDGNDNSYQPGDYQAGGGRQHSKTLVIDGRTENPVILTGSLNWSSSATIANDETLLVLSDSARITGNMRNILTTYGASSQSRWASVILVSRRVVPFLDP